MYKARKQLSKVVMNTTIVTAALGQVSGPDDIRPSRVIDQ